MSIAIFADPDDAIAPVVAALARARGATVHLVDAHGAQPLAWDGEAWILGGVELSLLRGVLVRQLPPRGALLDDPDATLTAGAWWRAGLAQSARAELMEACLRDLSARGVRVMNVPSIYDAKPTQLAAFARAGLPIPRTLLTNFAPAVRAFAADVGEVVIKPVLGGAEARVLSSTEAPDLPAILQARAAGVDVRVTLVAGAIVSAVEIPSTTLDYRSGEAYRAGTVEYRAHALSPDAASIAVRAAELTGQILSGVDLKIASDGAVTLIEANSAPVYLDIERKTGAPISAAIVDHLLGG